MLTCALCGAHFIRHRWHKAEGAVCSRACSGKANAKNLKPAPKGVRRSPATEFKAGMVPAKRVPVGTVTIRQRKNRPDRPRAWVKVAEPNRWRLRSEVVWEAAHGALDKGWVIHHRNRDSLDDSLSNLEAMTRADHLREHRHEFEEKRALAAAESRWGDQTTLGLPLAAE